MPQTVVSFFSPLHSAKKFNLCVKTEAASQQGPDATVYIMSGFILYKYIYGLETRQDTYRCICFNRDRLGLESSAQGLRLLHFTTLR